MNRLDQEELKRNRKRTSKKLSKITDERAFKREMKGLTHTQKMKMSRQRKKLLNKEIRKRNNREKENALNKQELPKKVENPKKNIKNLKSKRNLFSALSRKKPTNFIDEHNMEVDKQDLKVRGKVLNRIKTMKIKNKGKKLIKKTLKYLGLPSLMGIIIAGIFILSFGFILIGGLVSSIALSHPRIILELYKTNTLGNAIAMANVVKDVRKPSNDNLSKELGVTIFDDASNGEGEVLALGKGTSANAGIFSYQGVYNGTWGTPSGDISTYKKPDTNPDSNGSGTVDEVDASTVQGIIWNTFRSLGYSKEATAGVMGNVQQESNFVLTASNGTHEGLFQWDIGGRGANARKYCESVGSNFDTDAKCQVEFADKELKESLSVYFKYNATTYTDYSKFIVGTDISALATDFERVFERSGGSALDKRISYALAIYDQFA